MKPIKTDAPGSSDSRRTTTKSRMKKPPVHTTRYGTQYVRVSDILESEAGWEEIQRLREANLVLNESSNGREKKASPSDE
jgi:hypothetical protein